MAGVEDQVRLRILVDRYFSAVDGRDWAALGDCFCPDGSYSIEQPGPGGPMYATSRGREEVVATLRGMERFPFSTHICGSVVFDVRGNEASGQVTAIAVAARGEPGTGGRLDVRGLRYADAFRRDPGGHWQIAQRVLFRTWQSQISSVMPSAAFAETDAPGG